jgi:hypothetical protein
MPVRLNKNNQSIGRKIKATNYHKKNGAAHKENGQLSSNNIIQRVLKNIDNPINPLEYYHQQSLLFYLF